MAEVDFLERIQGPLMLYPNRVRSFYRGGAMIDLFTKGEKGEDSYFPEDWLGACFEPKRPGAVPGEGLGCVAVEQVRVRLIDLINVAPDLILGQKQYELFGAVPSVLVKLLDAGERLPVHCHPNRQFASEHLKSRFGKTESWAIIALREGLEKASIWLGFKDGVTPKDFMELITKQDSKAILDACNEYQIKPGDIIYVPAGLPHAIGKGILLLEPQEPSDYSILAEYLNFGTTSHDASLGLGWDTALQAFNFDTKPANVLEEDLIKRTVFGAGTFNGVSRILESEFFVVERFEANEGPLEISRDFLWIGIVLNGKGSIKSTHGVSLAVKKGVCFVVPAFAESISIEPTEEPIEILAVLPGDSSMRGDDT